MNSTERRQRIQAEEMDALHARHFWALSGLLISVACLYALGAIILTIN